MIRFLILLCCFLFSVIFTGCEHKQLCYDHPHGVATRIYVDWSKAPERPTGMSVYAYPKDGGECVVCQTNNIEYADLNLKDGDYHIVVFNQIPSEFETIGFGGLDTYEGAFAYAKERSKSWYRRSDSERVVHDVEWLGSATMDDIVVNNVEMQRHAKTRAASRFVELGTVRPQPRIVDIKVTVNVNGIDNVRAMRGSLDGLAAGCMLSNGAPLNEKATYLLEKWETNISKDDPTAGNLVCYISTFGLPIERLKVNEDNNLHLSALLVDNKTVVDLSYNVGDRFELNTDIGLELNLEVGTEEEDDGPAVMPDVEPAGGGGGFDVSVDDWGEVEDIEIPT